MRVVIAALTLSLLAASPAYAAAPDTTIDSGPDNGALVLPDTTVTYTFSSPNSIDHFECSLDNGAYATCTSPQSFNLGHGGHVFRVRAVNGSAEADASPAERIWTVRNLECEQAGEDYQQAQSDFFKYKTKKGYTKTKLQRAKDADNQRLIRKYTRKIKRFNRLIRDARDRMDTAVAQEQAVC